MSKWVRGIYNAAANFNMRNALQSAAGRVLDRGVEHVRQECDKPDQHIESSQSSKSPINYSDCTSATSTSTSTARANTSSGRASSSGSSTSASGSTSSTSIQYIGKDKDGNDIPVNLTITAREQDGAVTYTYSASREDASTRVRISNESRNIKQANANSADSIERCTGIPTGVTV